MVYFSFLGNHDAVKGATTAGAAFNIFKQYKKEINKVFLLVTPGTERADYRKIAEDNSKIFIKHNKDVKLEFVELNLGNPVDYDIVYPEMLNCLMNLIERENIEKEIKLINITSGTPTMSACWLLLSQSGIIKNARLIQSFEEQYARAGKTTIEVNLSIDDFPNIKAPERLKRELTILARQNKRLLNRLNAEELSNKIPDLIGTSEKIIEIKDQIANQIDDKTHVLILGETGTGKEVVAKTIWRLYHKTSDPKFEAFDCGSFSSTLIESELFGHLKGAFTGAVQSKEGLLKKFNNRTIFLDEIGNLPKEGQQKLLRVLSQGEIRKIGADVTEAINIQIVAATNKDVEDEAIFAQDIKNRFDEIILMPPLRDRREDIPLLVEHFLDYNIKAMSIPSPVVMDKSIMEMLVNHDWPDNIRGLEKWIQGLLRRYRNGGLISMSDLPANPIARFQKLSKNEIFLPDLPLPVPIAEYIDILIEKARKQANGNNGEVDRLLKQKQGTEKVRQHRERKNKKA